MARSSPLPLSLAVCLWAARALGDPPQGPHEALVDVAALSAEHARLLDAHRFDRGAEAVIAQENELTARAVEIAQQHPSIEVYSLLERLRGDALGAYLRTLAVPPALLVAAYLRRHRDPALLAYARATLPLDALAPSLARAGVVDAAPMLLRGIVESGRNDRERYCAEAMNLPPAEITALSTRLVPSLTPVSADVTGSHCLALLARSPAGLSALGRSVPSGASSPAAQTVAVEVSTALLLEARGRHAEATLRLDGALSVVPSLGNNWHTESATELSEIAPSLDGASPNVLRALRRTSRALGFERWRTLPLRLRARDPELAQDASDALRGSRVDHVQAEAYVMTVALSAPRAGTGPARELLGSLRVNLGVDVTGAQVDLWLDALDATDRCRDDACLARLLADGTDETAARAAFLLGDRGLSQLSPELGAATARRVLIRSAPRLASSLAVTLRACPTTLRALSGADPRVVEARGLRFDVYLRELSRRCAASPP